MLWISYKHYKKMYRVTYGAQDKPAYLRSQYVHPKTNKLVIEVQGPCFRHYKSAWRCSVGFMNSYKNTKLWFNGRLAAYTFNLDPALIGIELGLLMWRLSPY